MRDDNYYYVTAWNKLYRRSLFQNIRFPEGKIHEDEFTIHYFLDAANKVVCIKEELYFYVQRSNSIMHTTFSVKKLDGTDAMINRTLFFKKKGLKENCVFSARQAYGSLMLCLRNLNFYDNRRTLTAYRKRVAKLLGLDLRRVKLNLEFYARLWKTRLKRSYYKNYLRKNIKADGANAIVLLATPQHGNLGDQAIVLAEYQILGKTFPEKRIVEIPNECYLRFPDLCRKFIGPKTLIVIDGGGNLGSLWGNEDDKITNIIRDFKGNKIVIFPQTCFYSVDDAERAERNYAVYKDAKNLEVMLRDRRSYDWFQDLFPDVPCDFVPDIVLSLKPEMHAKRRDEALICFRTDLEKTVSPEFEKEIEKCLENAGLKVARTSTLVPEMVTKENRKKVLQNKLNEFASAKIIVCDRLHAMIFAAITKTPCIAFDNVSKKVSGVYEWIKDVNYIECINPDEFSLDLVKTMINVEPRFDEKKFAENFRPLVEILKKTSKE